jgi:hypothetical protein
MSYFFTLPQFILTDSCLVKYFEPSVVNFRMIEMAS